MISIYPYSLCRHSDNEHSFSPYITKPNYPLQTASRLLQRWLMWFSNIQTTSLLNVLILFRALHSPSASWSFSRLTTFIKKCRNGLSGLLLLRTQRFQPELLKEEQCFTIKPISRRFPIFLGIPLRRRSGRRVPNFVVKPCLKIGLYSRTVHSRCRRLRLSCPHLL